MNYVDLFCGAGGFSLGFDEAGFSNIFSVDIEPSFCQTYKANFPTHFLVEKDVATICERELVNLTKNKVVDVIIGGPPCQGFSMAGNIGRKFIDDARNQLFREFARIVATIKPKYFVMENVARLFSHQQGKTRQEITNLFTDMGYYVDCQVINAADFSVPQIRNRIVFIGNSVSNYIKFPDKKVNNYQNIKQAIGNLPKLHSGEKSTIPNHLAMKHSEQMLNKMSFITDGSNRFDIPELLRPTSGDVRKYIRYNSQEPSICITGDMRKVFHYEQNRALTVRELAKIQTFPDNFVFKGSTISQQQQVGNAVPPLLAKEIALTLLNMINHDAQISDN